MLRTFHIAGLDVSESPIVNTAIISIGDNKVALSKKAIRELGNLCLGAYMAFGDSIHFVSENDENLEDL